MIKKTKKIFIFNFFLVCLVLIFFLALGKGAVLIDPSQTLNILLKRLGFNFVNNFSEQQELVWYAIRTPRVLMAFFVGATLAASGSALQGLFRNPLADPGLLGISSGASLFVGFFVIFGIKIFGIYTLPFAAFLGSFFAIVVIFTIAKSSHSTNMTTMLLAGIAINALCFSGTGLMTYFSSDEQMRTITFWQMGSLGGANWYTVFAYLPFAIISLISFPFFSKALDALALGESDARNLGINVEKTKWSLIFIIALGVGGSVALCGMISFIGVVVPHLIRLLIGPSHKNVFVFSSILGAILLIAADLICRTLVAPLELPIGIATSVIGAPFFLYLILKNKKEFGNL